MLKRLLVSAVAALPLLALAGYAAASSERSATAAAAAATAAFHDLEAAQAAGYTVHVAELSGATCIDNGADGAMGDHFASLAEIGDGAIDAAEPEALLYEQRENGSFKLVALEYLVFKDAWDAGHTSPPSLFGHAFDVTTAPNRFGLPAYYSLHAWVWKPNPSGLLNAWNPSVSCGTS